MGRARQSGIPRPRNDFRQISVPASAEKVRNVQAGLVLIDTAPNVREMGRIDRPGEPHPGSMPPVRP
jgi:hypothetical protein